MLLSIIFLPLSVFVLMLGTIGEAQQNNKPNNTDEDGIRKAIEYYFQGHAKGDSAYMRKAFLPTARIEGMSDGKFVTRTLDEYCALFSGKPAEDENKRNRSINYIDISGNGAMARVTLDYGKIVFTDYFILLKVDSEWKIANKIWDLKNND